MYNDSQNCKTTVKLNRFFNIFNPKVYKITLFTIAIFIVFGIYLICTGKQSFAVYAVSAIILVMMNVLSIELHCPKKLLIGKDTIEFEDYHNVRPRNRHIRSGFWWLKVSYSVSDIKDIEFHQSFIEKIFDVGHISFSGKATFFAKRDIDRIKEQDTFVIYGIKNFSHFKLF